MAIYKKPGLSINVISWNPPPTAAAPSGLLKTGKKYQCVYSASILK